MIVCFLSFLFSDDVVPYGGRERSGTRVFAAQQQPPRPDDTVAAASGEDGVSAHPVPSRSVIVQVPQASGSYCRLEPAGQKICGILRRENVPAWNMLRMLGWVKVDVTSEKDERENYSVTTEGMQKMIEYIKVLSNAERNAWIAKSAGLLSGLTAVVLAGILTLQQNSTNPDPTAILYLGIPSIFAAVVGTYGVEAFQTGYLEKQKAEAEVRKEAALSFCCQLQSGSLLGNLPDAIVIIGLMRELISGKPNAFMFGVSHSLFRRGTSPDTEPSPIVAVDLGSKNTAEDKYLKVIERHGLRYKLVSCLLLGATILAVACNVTAFAFNLSDSQKGPSQVKVSNAIGNFTVPAISPATRNSISTTASIFNFLNVGTNSFALAVFGYLAFLYKKINTAVHSLYSINRLLGYLAWAFPVQENEAALEINSARITEARMTAFRFPPVRRGTVSDVMEQSTRSGVNRAFVF